MQIKMTPRLVLAMATLFAIQARASTGVTLPLNQYQAGTEVVNNTLVTNGNFEQPGVAGPGATGWEAYNDIFVTPAMSVAAPAVANPTFGSFSAQAGLSNLTANDNYIQDVTLDPNTEYVLSGYMWSYGVPRPSGGGLVFGDLAGVELFHQDAGSNPVTTGMFVESNLPILTAGGSGADGVFIYQSFSGSLFPNGASLQVRSDPQQSVAGTRPAVMARWDNVAITPLNTFRSQVWTSSASGTWGDNTKWLNNQANAQGAIATFSNQAAPVTVTLEEDKSLGTLQFDSTSTYTIAGTNKIILQRDLWDNGSSFVTLQALRGSHTINVPLVVGEPYAGTERTVKLNVAASSVLSVAGDMTAATTRQFHIEKLGAGRADMKAIRAKTVKITAGTLGLLAGPVGTPVLRTTSLSIGAGAKLDLRNGIGIVDYTGASPLAVLSPMLVTGGITASSANNNLVAVIKEANGASIFGEATDTTTIALISTFKGDSDIDRDVDFDDLLTLAQNYGSITALYAQGDNNYDAKVDFDDLLSLAQNYNATFGLTSTLATSPTGSFQSDWAFALSIVPEPTALGLIACGALAGRRRR